MMKSLLNRPKNGEELVMNFTTITGVIVLMLLTLSTIVNKRPANASTLTIGPGKEYYTLASAVNASNDGYVLQIQAGTYTNDYATINKRIRIVGVGGLARL